jgi:hypothetical protein
MSVTNDRGDTRAGANAPRGRYGGPVVLATLAGAPFGPHAARVAVEAAAEMRSKLVVVEMVEARSRRGRAAAASKPFTPALAATVRDVKAFAAASDVEIEAVRVTSPRPIAAMLNFVSDRSPALVVFATDPAALRAFRRPTRRQSRRFLAALTAGADCLIWTAEEPGARAAVRAGRRAARAVTTPLRGVRPGEALGMIKPSTAGGAAGG